MQYFRPAEPNRFVGDCMPFYHDGLFQLYYLLDEGHHSALGGLGGHQWAHASSSDLITWTHHPLALPITAPWEGSICTGSLIAHKGAFYAFYATRIRDRTQHLSMAWSHDGIHFDKLTPNPFASPPEGYSPYHYRDPFVFQHPETGRFSMLVTAWLDRGTVPGRGGCLAHLTSDDLRAWTVEEPFLVPGLEGPPECPELFVWNDWWYLVFSNGLTARYRMARHPNGPWTRPREDTFEGQTARVMKTAPFTGNRRIGVAWLGTRKGDQDRGAFQWGGNAVFRELVQHADGTLGVTWPREMVPQESAAVDPQVKLLTSGAVWSGQGVALAAASGMECVRLAGLPRNFRLRARVHRTAGYGTYGLRLRAGEAFDSGYALTFAPGEGTVRLGDDAFCRMRAPHKAFDLDVVAQDSIIDVRIGDDGCLIDRCPEQQGDQLVFYALDASVTLANVTLTALPARGL